MALTEDKFVFPSGAPTSSRQPMLSSEYGDDDIRQRPLVGWADYAHSVSALQTLTGNIWTNLANNSASSFTNTDFLPDGVSEELWNSTANQFEFGSLNVGDMVNLRIDLSVTVPNNVLLQTRLEFQGSGGFTLHTSTNTFRNAGTYQITAFTGIYIGAVAKALPMRVQLWSDTNLTSPTNGYAVKGWYVQVFTKR